MDALPYGTLKLLQAGHQVFIRTEHHPVVIFLRELGIAFTTFDQVYDRADSFDQVYQSIAEQVIDAAKDGIVIYAVPGHPAMAERSVKMIADMCRDGLTTLHYGPGQSFLDDMMLRLQVDPIEGLLVLDATDIEVNLLLPKLHLVVVQMYNRAKASDVKLTLSEIYGDEHQVTLVHAVGVPDQEEIRRLPLFEIDQVAGIDHLTTLYVPPITKDEQLFGQWQELLKIVEKLRSPDGCPWDMEQTHESLRSYVIEEAYEVAHEIDTGNMEGLVEELGDLLLQVALHSQIGKEEGYFDASDVIKVLSEKLIRRHPHVFGDVTVANVSDVIANWQKIKDEEKLDSGNGAKSILDEVGEGRPPFKESIKLQKIAANVGFGWPEIDGVYDKLKEEINELYHAYTPTEKLDELGDILFVIANLARFLDVDPERALMHANRKFRERFRLVEEALHAQSLSFDEVTLDILEGFWQNAKVKADS